MRIVVAFCLFAGLASSGHIAAQSEPSPSAGGRGQAAAPAAAAAAPAGNAANGKKLYVSYGCYQCHGYEGQGASGTGPRLGPRPIPYAAFSRYVRRPTNQMPPFTAKIASDQDLADIYAFLQSLPAPPPVESIQLLK